MKLELNLVKKQSIDSNLATLISRNRYTTVNDSEVMTSILNFIKDNSNVFTAANKDQRFNSSLASLNSLTYNQLDCLRYYLGVNCGLDIWYWYVADEEINTTEVPSGIFEYNVVDYNTMNGLTPFTSKIQQSNQDNNLIEVYSKINDIYGLFSSDIFAGITNPLKSQIEAAKSSMELIGKIPQVQSSLMNYILQYVHKDIKVIVS